MRDAKENCEEREILGVDEGARGVRKEGLSTFALTCDQTSFLFCVGKVPRKKDALSQVTFALFRTVSLNRLHERGNTRSLGNLL